MKPVALRSHRFGIAAALILIGSMVVGCTDATRPLDQVSPTEKHSISERRGSRASDDSSGRVPPQTAQPAEANQAIATTDSGKTEHKSSKRDPIYDIETSGKELIAAAVHRANRDRKHVVIEWGGNWCGWCYRLHDVFMHDPIVQPILSEHYELVLVESDKNRDLLLKYGGKDRQFSYPHLTVLDFNGRVLTNQKTEPFEEGSAHNPKVVAEFLKKWAPEKLDAERPASHTLRGTVIDVNSKQPLPARVSIRSTNGTWYFPKSASPLGTAIDYKRQVGPTSLEQHVTLSAHPFQVDLPTGTYIITVERGKEYVPLTREVTVTDQSTEVELPLRRWIHMAGAGWYSGDVHAHRPLADVPNLVLAEDLNVAMPLSNWVTSSETSPVTGNRIAEPVPPPGWMAVDATHGIYPLNTEFEIFTVGSKSHTLGAVLILGQTTSIDQGVPPVRRIAEKAHRESAFLDLEKHSWAWTPMIVPLMKPDLFELVNNHCWPSDFAFHSWTFDMAPKSMHVETNAQGFTEWGWIEFGLKSYYAYLNCGFRMMPSAGTGSGVHPVPLGFGRVYVHVAGDFTYEKWRQGLLAGRSFVTTGPLMQLTFNGQPPGHTFQTEAQETNIRIRGTVSSLSPLDRVEIVVNGIIVKTISEASPDQTKDAAFVTSLDETITVKGSSWIAVRSFDARPDHRIRFAHTAPVFVDVSGQTQAPFKDEVEHFIERIEREIERHKGVLAPDALDEYQEALTTYRDLQGRAIPRPDAAIAK